MGPLPNTWWMHYNIDSLTWVFAFWEAVHFDFKNRGIFLFWKPSGNTGWYNYWRNTPESYIRQNFIHRNPHVGWFIWNWGVKVEKLWNRIR